MQSTSFALLLSLTILATPVLAKEPTDAELNDWMHYLRSVGIPSTVETCGAVVHGKARFDSAAQGWLSANGERVARGQKVALAGLSSKWASLDEYNAAMVEDYQAKFAKISISEKKKICSDYLAVLEKGSPESEGK